MPRLRPPTLLLVVAVPAVAVPAVAAERPSAAAPAPSAGGPADYPMVRVPAGSFVMGSPADEAGRHSREVQHEVTLSRSFWMGTTEVTQGL
jgi:formylglycine-generating enzyme required for sulfatase activity